MVACKRGLGSGPLSFFSKRPPKSPKGGLETPKVFTYIKELDWRKISRKAYKRLQKQHNLFFIIRSESGGGWPLRKVLLA